MKCNFCNKDIVANNSITVDNLVYCNNLCRYSYNKNTKQKSNDTLQSEKVLQTKKSKILFYKLFRIIPISIGLIGLVISIYYFKSPEAIPVNILISLSVIITLPIGFALTFFPSSASQYFISRRFYWLITKLPRLFSVIFFKLFGGLLLLYSTLALFMVAFYLIGD